MQVNLKVPDVWAFRIKTRGKATRTLYLRFSQAVPSDFFREQIRDALSRKGQDLLRKGKADDGDTIDVYDIFVRHMRLVAQEDIEQTVKRMSLDELRSLDVLIAQRMADEGGEENEEGEDEE